MDSTVRLALHAMATRFELVLHGDDTVRLRAAGEQALATIERLERLLSFYRGDSEITVLNTEGAERPVRLSGEVFGLLRRCAELTANTEGAFDVTVGPLMRAWRFVGEKGGVPRAAVLDMARTRVGAHLLEFDDEQGTVRARTSGVEVDLGGVGKGYAIDAAIEELRNSGITSALLHGGTSSVHALGTPPGRETWAVSWAGAPDATHAVIRLRDRALSVSAAHGKAFIHEGRQYGHVLDPLTGQPVSASSACVTGPRSYLCDALSTALLVRGEEWLPKMRERWPEYEGWVTKGSKGSQGSEGSKGLTLEPP
jgi:FAD:protein FMN transferase